MKKIYAALLLVIAAGTAFAANTLPVERYALYIAANDGGSGRETLRYAATDAARLAGTLFEIGGVKPENSMILSDPTKADIANAFATISQAVSRNAGRAKRTEFIFYYSGHSDETAFLIGTESYRYAELKAALAEVPTDVHVVMLDSCFSGNFIRTKGGSRDKPFLMDDSSVVQGHAYLSSSSETETSQESDTIQASYFTQALVTGLRGAADANGDGKVSLNELYYYAFNDTLSNTEASTYGPQHPSYNITLVGSGDLILTDLSESEALLAFPKQDQGKYFVRMPGGQLVSEINKTVGTELVLALPSGIYNVSLLNATGSKQTVISLRNGERLLLGSESFGALPLAVTRPRGDIVADEGIDEDFDIGDEDGRLNDELAEGGSGNLVPLMVSVFPGMAFPGTSADDVNISAGIFMAANHNVTGMQISAFSGSITGNLQGIQAAGFMSSTGGRFQGVQAAGFMNTVSGRKGAEGIQAAGFMNTVQGNYTGVQGSGFMNMVSGDLSGIQGTGFLNIVGGRADWIQASGFMNHASRGFDGFQIASFLNTAGGRSSGIQGSGFLNIASSISGMQVGVINIAGSNKGIALGILNIIGDGVLSPSYSQDTENTAWLAYHGGTRSLFTSFHIGWDTSKSPKYGAVGFGIGTRFMAENNLSLDLEIIGKQFFTQDRGEEFRIRAEAIDNVESEEEQERLAAELAMDNRGYFIPSARITANFMFMKHFGIFATAGVDLHVTGFNDEAFLMHSRIEPYPLNQGEQNLYPTFSAGIRF